MKKPQTNDLRELITNAARESFTELRDAHPNEKFYAYALFTNGEANDIAASANTEDGLICRARQYEAKQKKGIKEHARILRWSPSDWAYHCVGEEQFEAAQKALLDEWESSEDAAIDNYEKGVETRLAIFVDALKTLGDEGFFGRGATRQGVTLLVLMGDQETKLLLKCAQQLNPAKVYKEFSSPFLRSTAGKFKGIGSKNVYQTVGVSVSRNGKVLACAGSSASGWPCIFAFALPSKKEILRLVFSETIGLAGIAVSPDGTSIIACWGSLSREKDGGIRCWDVRTKKTRWNTKGLGNVSCMDISPDGVAVATGSLEGIISISDASNGKLIRKILGHKDGVQSVRFSPSAGILASSDRETAIRFWNFDSGKQVGQITDSGDCIAFSPDGTLLAVATGYAENRNYVSIWDVSSQKLIARLDAVSKSRFQVAQGPDDYANCQASGVAFSPDGRLLAVERSWPGSVVLWDWKMKKELIWMNPNYESLSGVAFLPDGKSVAVAGRSMNGPPLLLWDISEAIKRK